MKKETLSDFVKSLTEEKLKEMAKEIGEGLAKQEAEDLAFYNSPRFREVITKINKYLETNKGLTDDPYQEPLFDDVSNEEFLQTFDCVFKFPKLPIEKDPKACFYTEYVIFEDLVFKEMHGQGTAFIVQKKENI